MKILSIQKEKKLSIIILKIITLYKDFIGKTDVSDWNEIPVMTKKEFQKPLSERLSKGFNPKNVYVNKTSGSSGDPFIFAKDKFCHALTWANIIHRFGWFGINFNSSFKHGFMEFRWILLEIKKNRLKDLLSNRYRFTIFDLSDAVLEKTSEKISE